MNNEQMRAWVNAKTAEWAQQRAQTQMTLGKLIDRLSELDPQMMMSGLNEPHSYRGYYSDLAFEACDKRPVADVLADARKCMGEIFTGYKGGEYTMGRNTPVWVSEWGHCSELRIMGINDDGTIEIEKEE